MTGIALTELVVIAGFMVVVALVAGLVVLALNAGYDRLALSPRALALMGGAVVLLGQVVLAVLALRTWAVLWAAGPDSPASGPGWAQSELGPAAAVQTAAPYVLGVIGASAVMLTGACVIALAAWKASRRSSTAPRADVPSVVSGT